MTVVAEFTYRDARKTDARDIAELFQISSDGAGKMLRSPSPTVLWRKQRGMSSA
jgi:hypothetical protein